VPNVGDWYEARKGNVNGLPVTHIAVNIVPQDFLQVQADAFVNDYGIRICANDYNFRVRQGSLETNAVHDLFQAQFLKPVFLVINCVSNSPSHTQYSLLLNQGGGPADWNVAIAQWHAAIDSVQAPPPQLTNARLSGGTFQFTFPGQRGRTNQVQCSSNFVNWTVLTNVFGTNAPITFRDTNAVSGGQRFYRVRRL
jgi:hypothetical protein